MPPEPAPRIFISYAWKNQPIAKRLQSDFKRDGVEVFVDYERIIGGDSLPARISAGLDWCNILVLLWSADSTQSYYVTQEWTSAFHLQKRIIACVLDGTPLPALLASRLYLNFTPYETGYIQLCRSLGVTPKVIAEETAPPQALATRLQPQHAEIPVPQPLDEPRDSSPPKRNTIDNPFRREPKPAKPTPMLKPPEVFDDTENDHTKETARVAPLRWSWRKTTGVIIIIIVIAIFFKQQMLCREPSNPTSGEGQTQRITPTEQPAATPAETKPAGTSTPAETKTTQPTVKENAPTEVKLVELDLKLPKPMFIGTPQNLQVAKLEKPLGKPRPPFLAPEGTKNVAAGRPVKSSDEAPVIGELKMITDGDCEAGDGSYVELGPFLQNVTIDLGKKHTIYAILAWHFHKQPRVYYDVIVQVADDANFTSNVATLYNNDLDNSAKMGTGADNHFVETAEGRLIDAKGVQGRYVRLYSNGNSNDDLNHYIEVAVYGKPAGAI